MTSRRDECEHCDKPGFLLPYYVGMPEQKHVWLHQGCSAQWHENWRARGMAFEHKPESGSLFRNKRKEKENHPDHQGSCKIDGVDYYISAWINTKDDGEKFFGLKFKRKDEAKPDEKPTESGDAFDDGIPF